MKDLVFGVVLILVWSTFIACNQKDQTIEKWKIVYRHNAAGESIQGDKNELIHYVRNGYPIRIGFGGRRRGDTLQSVEHVADAQFLTIASGQEVFAQITPIFGQKPNLELDSLSIVLNHKNNWTMIIGTNGERSTLSKSLRVENQQESRQSRRGATWFVKCPMNGRNKHSKPLWD